jgi:hypothetical protein
MRNKKNLNKIISDKPIFFVALFNFFIIILLVIYIIYLRFVPYTTLEYDGYAVSGKEIVNSILSDDFDNNGNIKALKVSDQDEIYQNLKSYYVGASKKDNINLDYPIYVNDSLAVYNLSSNVKLITDDFDEVIGYSGFTLTSGALYNSSTRLRADYYDYMLMKNSDNVYINTKEIEIDTAFNNYTIPMNSIINFTSNYITYYSLDDDEFVYSKILDIDDSSVISVADYNKEYTYKEYLLGLDIIREDTTTDDTTNTKEEKEKKKKVIKVVNEVVEEPVTEEPTVETVIVQQPEEEEEDNTSVDVEVKWVKPEVTCTDFVANVYSANTVITIKDPSRVIYKAVTFTFYKDGEVAFRASSTSGGDLQVTKLLPSTTYKIVGTYQYRNKEGSLLENTILEQEITTKGVENLNPIDLSFKNGQIYSSKIEIADFKIASDINDEAIYGVSKAEILINGSKNSIDSATLRSILKGDSVTYQSPDGLKSNSSYEYEIKFYDTAGNEMKLTNKTGSTVTSKKEPTVKIKASVQEVISATIQVTLTNEDNVELDNYRYILYSSTGEIKERGQLSKKDESIKFDDLDPQDAYTIKIYADYDIEDGNGKKTNQEIGDATFITLPISKLGNLKLNVTYDEDQDLTENSINLRIAVNTTKTDSRLVKILKEINLQIKDDAGNVIAENVINNVNALSTEDGVQTLISNLKSNTTYYIDITAVAKQGSVEEAVTTSYTLNKFITNKAPVTIQVKNVIETTELVDMDIYVEDIDGACTDDIVTIRFIDDYEKEYLPEIEPTDTEDQTKISNVEKIPTNKWVRLTYLSLKEEVTYNLTCEVASYNETHDETKVLNNYLVDTLQFTTTGLSGEINLTGLTREKTEEGINLIDVNSDNNWYSKVFDIMNSSYSLDEANKSVFTITSEYNYGKEYISDNTEYNNSLKLLSNQCYVYDFTDYIGETVTISGSIKVTDESAKVYLQKGTEIGEDEEEIKGLSKSNWLSYQKTVTVPNSGYLGFFIQEAITETSVYNKDTEETETVEVPKDYYVYVKDLKVEIGSLATKYTPYEYNLYANTNVKFLDKKHKTYDENLKTCRYYIRLIASTGDVKEYNYTYDSEDVLEELFKYVIPETKETVGYTLQILVKQNGREYILDTVEFSYNPSDRIEIKSISSIDDYLKIQPNGNYIILNDLDFSNTTSAGQYTFGGPNVSFNGSIDYNGKTIIKNTYSNQRKNDTTSYLFYEISEKAEIKNIVVDYYINNKTNRLTKRVEGNDVFYDEKDGLYSVFLYNSGSINNVMINLKESTEKQRIYVGLVGYRNDGTIEDFVINYEKILYGSQYLAGVCLYSTGTVQNGYIYGAGITAIGDIVSSDYRYIAGVVFQVEAAGLLQNVYNISNITMNHCDGTYSYAANIVYNLGYPPDIDMSGNASIPETSTAVVRNVYSVTPINTNFDGLEYEGLLDAKNQELYLGPNILNKYTETYAKESYYFCDMNYEANDYNSKTSATALYEAGVQDVMLNANGYSEFLTDVYVSNGYYPHLNLNYCMPDQINNKINLTGKNYIDVLSGYALENNDISTLELTDRVKSEIESYIHLNNIDLSDENITIAVFRIFNPAGTTMSEINVNYLDSYLMSQSYSKKVSTAYVLLSNPTSFLDTYTVSSIRSRQANGRVMESIYGEDVDAGIRTIDVTYTKYISTAEEWANINNDDVNGVSGLVQNYRLTADIDFASSEYSPYITGTFSGNIDGKYNGIVHKLSNIEGTTALIDGFSEGCIQNLYIDGFKINSSSRYLGLIAKAELTDNITLNNIHMSNVEISSSYSGDTPYIGGLCAYIHSNYTNDVDKITIQNCSIQYLDISFSSTSATNVEAGGLVGHLEFYGGVETSINNCYIQNLNTVANITSVRGIGGLVGYKHSDSASVIKPGTHNTYIKNCYTTGKINTYNYTGGIIGYASYPNTYIQNCYSMVNITSKMESGDAYIGGIVGITGSATKCITNNFYLGNIYVSGNNVKQVNRIAGNKSDTTSYNNYAYADQLMSGKPLTTALGAKLLTTEQCFEKNTYSNLLQWDENYAYVAPGNDGTEIDLLENEYLPKLNDTEGNLLPNQKFNALDNDLKLTSIVTTPSADKTKVTVEIKFENPNNLKLTGVQIENNNMNILYDTWKTEVNDKGLTVVTFDATPNRAYDSYKIQNIYYEKSGQTNEKEIITKIQVELYQSISSAEQWIDFFTTSGKEYTGQNIKIQGNIDFSGMTEEQIASASNVIVGRLEADSTDYTISNVTLSGLKKSEAFINEIKISLKNINFSDCEITGKGDYIGLIGISRSGISNCKFENIKINCDGYSYIGIVSRSISGSFNNITLTKVKCTGNNYVGGLCGQTTSLGSSKDISGTYISIKGTGSKIGGLFGYTQGSIQNLSAYQYTKEGKIDDDEDTKTEFLVSGYDQVGGCIGQYDGGSSTVKTVDNAKSTIKGRSDVGGNIGYGGGVSDSLTSTENNIIATGDNVGGNVGRHGWTVSNAKSSNNEIQGKNRVGGNCGGSGNATDKNLDSSNNTITCTTGSYAGGCVGYITDNRATSTNLRSYGENRISATNYVGGVIGCTEGRAYNIKAENCEVIATGDYVGGTVGRANYANTSISNSSNSNYTVSGSYTKNLKITGASYVGGSIGYLHGTLYGAVVDNTEITGSKDFVGGITGYYTAYEGGTSSAISSTSFFLWHSYCVDSTVEGNNYVGGITGGFVYGNIQYCYVGNTSITADTSGAGGLVGYFDNEKMSNLQYKATIKYNFIANVIDSEIGYSKNRIYSKESVGGLIGIIKKSLKYDEEVDYYNNVECNLVVADISVTTGYYVDMGIGSVDGKSSGISESKYMNNIYIYNRSRRNGTQVANISEYEGSYKLISREELLNTDTYLQNDSIYDEETNEVTGYEGLNFTKGRFDYTSGYFPKLKTKYSNAESYWDSNNLNVSQQSIAIPDREAEATTSSISIADLEDIYADNTSSKSNEVADVYVYAVDVDKINIEFGSIVGDFSVKTDNDVIIARQSIDKMVYTLEYDFKTPLYIKVSNSNYYYTEEVTTEKAQNLLSIVNDEYFYLDDGVLNSNKRTIDGEFVNIYEDKALDSSGNIYDILTKSKLNTEEIEIKVLDEEVPISQSQYGDSTIQTFYHCTKVINSDSSAYKDKQIFVKNGNMYVIDGNLKSVGNAILIDSYNNNQYEAVLGTDGIIYNLLTEIKYPTDFSNSNIIAMTNNVNNNDNVVLVYYSTGKVCAFNYITGEEVYSNSVEENNISLLSYLASNLSLSNLAYDINKADYKAAQELTAKLEKVSVESAMDIISPVENTDDSVEDVAEGNVENNGDTENVDAESETENNKTESTAENNTNSNDTVASTLVNTKDTSTEYIPTYDATTQSYVVYSSKELTNPKVTKVVSENSKIDSNSELASYYASISTNKTKIENVGITVIAIIIGTICVTLIVIYKKNNKFINNK